MDNHDVSQLEIAWLEVFVEVFVFLFQLSIIKLLRWNKRSPIVNSHAKIEVKDDENTNINVIPEFFPVVIIVVNKLIVFLKCEVKAGY